MKNLVFVVLVALCLSLVSQRSFAVEGGRRESSAQEEATEKFLLVIENKTDKSFKLLTAPGDIPRWRLLTRVFNHCFSGNQILAPAGSRIEERVTSREQKCGVTFVPENFLSQFIEYGKKIEKLAVNVTAIAVPLGAAAQTCNPVAVGTACACLKEPIEKLPQQLQNALDAYPCNRKEATRDTLFVIAPSKDKSDYMIYQIDFSEDAHKSALMIQRCVSQYLAKNKQKIIGS